MASSDRGLGHSIPTILVLIAVTTGAFLPWIRPNPGLTGETDAIPAILLPKMNAGLEGYSLLLLVPVLAVLSILVFGRTARYRSLATLLVGGFTVLLPIYYLRSTSLAGFDSTFVPAPGWYVTIAGGLLLVIAGAVHRSPAERTDEPSPKSVN